MAQGKRGLNVIKSIIAYAGGLIILIQYFYLALSNRYILHPAFRMLLLMLGVGLIYIGSLSICFQKDGRPLVKNEKRSRFTNGQFTDRIMKITFAFFFLLYIVLLADLLFFDMYFGRVGFNAVGTQKVVLYRYLYNLKPFKTIRVYVNNMRNGVLVRSAIVNIAGNLVAFMPFALFIPLLLKKFSGFGAFTATTLVINILVEVMQLIIHTGSCDIDDVILNMAGACAAYLIFHIPPVGRLIEKITCIEYLRRRKMKC